MIDVWKNRETEDLYRMCEGLIAEKKRLRAFMEGIATACEATPRTVIEEGYARAIREVLKIDLSIPLLGAVGNAPETNR